MNIDACPIHLGKALGKIDELRRHPRARATGRVKEEATLRHAIGRVKARSLGGNELEIGARIVMGVNVDGAGAGFAARRHDQSFLRLSSASKPLRRSSGLGGQPGICRSTGTTASTPPTMA